MFNLFCLTIILFLFFVWNPSIIILFLFFVWNPSIFRLQFDTKICPQHHSGRRFTRYISRTSCSMTYSFPALSVTLMIDPDSIPALFLHPIADNAIESIAIIAVILVLIFMVYFLAGFAASYCWCFLPNNSFPFYSTNFYGHSLFLNCNNTVSLLFVNTILQKS